MRALGISSHLTRRTGLVAASLAMSLGLALAISGAPSSAATLSLHEIATRRGEKAPPFPTAVVRDPKTGAGSIVVSLPSPDSSIRLEDLNRHLFGLLADPGRQKTPFLYEAGFFFGRPDPLALASKVSVPVLSPADFLELLRAFKSMKVGSGVDLPSPERALAYAQATYKLTGLLPLAVIDLAFEQLDRLDAKKLGLGPTGRLVRLKRLDYRAERLFVAAPLIEAVPARVFGIVVDPKLVFSDRNIAESLRLRTNSTDEMAVRPGTPLTLRVGPKDAFAALAVSETRSGRRAVSWISLQGPSAPIPSKSGVVLRRSTGPSGALGTEASAGPRFLSYPPMEAWAGVPVCGGMGRFETEEGKSAFMRGNYEGIEFAIYLSERNRGLPEEEWDLDPVIFLGGQGIGSNDPAALFGELAIRLGMAVQTPSVARNSIEPNSTLESEILATGRDRLTQLRSKFDLILLTYYHSLSDPSSSEQDDVLSSIGRSVERNALLLGDALFGLYCHYDIKKPAAFVGISMGGIVSRLAFLGIENGPIQRNGYQDYPTIPNFGEGVVPVRLWVTIDSPHQGAYLPLGLQDWLHALSTLLGSSNQDVALLDSPSSKELLREHYSAGAGVATPERVQLLHRIEEAGTFPWSIECTAAVASGSIEVGQEFVAGQLVSRLPLWRLGNQQCADEAPCPSYFGSGHCDCAEGKIPKATPCTSGRGCTDYHFWDVDWAAAGEVASNRARNVPTYSALGPGAIPLQQFRLSFMQEVGNNEVSVSLTSDVSEATYPTHSFTEVQNSPSEQDEQRNMLGTLEPIESNRVSIRGNLRAKIELKVNIIVDAVLGLVDVDTITLDQALNLVQIPHERHSRPHALLVGGYRTTVDEIGRELEARVGSHLDYLTNYLPRHAFVPTISALDVDPGYLAASYYHRLTEPVTYTPPEWERALRRGIYQPENFLEWGLLTRNLGPKVSEQIVVPPSPIPLSCGYQCIRAGGSCKSGACEMREWNGRPSPFDWLFWESNSLEHACFGSESLASILRLIDSSDCSLKSGPGLLPPGSGRVPGAPPWQYEEVLKELPSLLPPLVPCPPQCPPVPGVNALMEALGLPK